MAFFRKNKKEQSVAENMPYTNDDRIFVYKDGVFEVYEDKTDGKKYGRIINYHGSEKIIPIDDEAFEMWRDASENFGKYRVTYERDEDFYIEKASISLAEAPKKKASFPQDSFFSSEQSEKADGLSELAQELADFYEKAKASADGGKAMLEKATLEQVFSACFLCDRAIIDIAKGAKMASPDKKELKITVPADVARLSGNAKKALFERITKLEKIYVICSSHTKRQHSAGGNAQIALTRKAAEDAVSLLDSHGQKVFFREVENEVIGAEIRDIICNGLGGIRFLYTATVTCVLQVAANDAKNKIQYPENIALRRAMTAFFQDYSNGVAHEKLKGTELAMYDAMFRSTLLQPCSKKNAEGGTLVSLSVVRNSEGACLMNLFTSPEIMERSASAQKFRHENPENAGYKKWTFDDMLAEISSGKGCNGFVIDGEYISVPFSGPALERVKKFKQAWEQNGKTFIAKPSGQE